MRTLLMPLLVALLLGLVIPAGAGALYPYPVTVTVNGPGVVTDATDAINCPGTCSTAYASGQSATFTETPQSGQQFGGWSTAAPVIEGCTATSTICQVKIDCDECGSSVSVAATFDPVPNVAVTGSGTVTGTGGVSGGPLGTPLTPTQPPIGTPPAKLQAVVSLGSRIARVDERLARFEIDCRRSHVTCSGKLTLTLAQTRRKANAPTLGSARFSVTAGKRAALDVHLSTTAGALLNADHGRLHAAATLTLTGLKPGAPTPVSLHRHS